MFMFFIAFVTLVYSYKGVLFFLKVLVVYYAVEFTTLIEVRLLLFGEVGRVLY
jgi:hypothetical protein